MPATYKPQSLNRYSYCLNNPLLYTDPSGHAWYNDWDDFKKMWRNFIVDDTPQEGAIWTSGYVEPDNPNAYEDHEKKDRPFTPSKKALLENMPKDFARNVTVGVLTRFGLEKLKKLGSGAGTTPTEENWPPNRGFEGDPEPTTLQPGKMIDRYGSDSGSFASPQGTPASARSLRPGTETKPLNTYEVVKPLDVDAGRTASWFGQPGGGTQYDLGRSVQELVKDGFLKPVP